MKISSEIVDELCGTGGVCQGWTHVASQYDSSGRWHDWYTMILKDPEGQFWGIDYGLGATENQENELPWKDTDQVELTRLYPHTVTTIEYRSTP